jgi:hypothetical protein
MYQLAEKRLTRQEMWEDDRKLYIGRNVGPYSRRLRYGTNLVCLSETTEISFWLVVSQPEFEPRNAWVPVNSASIALICSMWNLCRLFIVCYDNFESMGAPVYFEIQSSIYLEELTPWSWALLEQPPVTQLLKNFPIFYETRGFITMFKRALHWPLSSARSHQSVQPHPISLRLILILSTHLCFYLLSSLFPTASVV